MQCHYSTQPNHMHKNLSTSGNSSSPSCTPLFEHMLTHATIKCASTNTPARLHCNSHETATTSTRTRATHTLNHKTEKQSPSSNGSYGQGHGQAPQLQTANEQPEIQKSMEPLSSQQILDNWQMTLEGTSKTPPTLLSSSLNTRYRQTTSRTDSLYAWSDPKRQNPTNCNSQ
jgi:hypothetical protein